MGWGELEDLTGRVKVLFYPKTYEEFSALIRKSSIIFVKGRLEKRDRVMIIADEVANINTAKDKFLSNVEIDVKLPLQEEKLGQLKELFIKNKGNCPLYLNLIKDGNRKVKVKANGYTVNPDVEFIEDLKAILGDASSFHIGV